MENNNIKMNFWQKIKTAIFNLEKYGVFISENVGKSLKYMFLLILIFTMGYTVIYTYDISKMVDKGFNYIQNEMPEFNLEEGKIKFEGIVNGYDSQYDFKIDSIEKDELEQSEINTYYQYSQSLILLNEKILFITNGQNIDYSYDYVQETFGTTISNKQDLINAFNTLGGKNQVVIALGITLFISFLAANSYQIFIDCLIVAIYGYLVARINRIKIKVPTAITLSIYSLTLSTILNFIYVIVYYFTKFEIPYFGWLYLIIAYIYITAAILMIKTDLIKQVMELKKIEEEQKKVKQEIEENNLEKKLPEEKKEEKKEEEQEEKKDEINVDRQPDGSEI